MCAFLFLGAVTGVLEMSDMGVLEITNGSSPLPPSWGWGDMYLSPCWDLSGQPWHG